MRRHRITLTTIADGSVTGYSPRMTGKIMSLRYVKHATAAYSDGVDTVITKESDGAAVLTATDHNASASFGPRMALNDVAGAAALRVAAGLPLLGQIGVANDRLKFVVAAGGDAKIGDWYVTVE